MALLSLAQQQAAEKLAQKIFQWERLAEEHGAVLRSDENQLAGAYLECKANMSPVGSLPPPEQLASCIAKAERDLEVPATTFPQHIMAVCNCAFFCRVTLDAAAGEDYEMFMESRRLCALLHEQHFKANPQIPLIPLNLAIPPRNETIGNIQERESIDYPIMLPARSLTFEEFGNATHVKVSGADIECYRQNPYGLLGRVFFSENWDGEGEKLFRVSTIMTTEDQGHLFYLVFAGEGPEAMCHPHKFFYEDLLGSSLVKN
ncbi:hypothetical protein GGX14DRAFT_556708 [Mycena pura]|uniref:Uncharacterized protein n=1 Tax=Mycena pura TaxID=153505 RepID=A0AAD6YQ55_9AGAR|nr:hypothetical protein GGX14DRAFT_556708 [Mycena pura]